MRALALLVAASVSLTLLAACDGAKKPPFLPETSPTPDTAGLGGFRAFAGQIAQAIRDGDGQLFVDRAQPTQVMCTGKEEDYPCFWHAAGFLEGIWFERWRTEVVDLVPPEDVAADFESFVSAAAAGESDRFGRGEAALYAIASGPGAPAFRESFYAILTAISGQPPGRSTIAYQFSFSQGRWRLLGEVHAWDESLFVEWLNGTCADCYDQWERWEGTP